MAFWETIWVRYLGRDHRRSLAGYRASFSLVRHSCKMHMQILATGYCAHGNTVNCHKGRNKATPIGAQQATATGNRAPVPSP